jgi:hypothetical protein
MREPIPNPLNQSLTVPPANFQELPHENEAQPLAGDNHRQPKAISCKGFHRFTKPTVDNTAKLMQDVV